MTRKVFQADIMFMKRYFKICFGVVSATSLILLICVIYGTFPHRARYDPDWRPPDLTLIHQAHQTKYINLSYTSVKPSEDHTGKLDKLIKKNKHCQAAMQEVKKPSRSSLVNNIWHIIQGTSGEVMVFGAYFDTRQNIFRETVRILAVSTTKASNAVFCQLWYTNVSNPLIVKASVKDTGRGLGLGGKKYQERLYSCEIETRLVLPPHSVSLTFSECANSSSLIPVHFPTQKHEHDFGICVVVAYGSMDPIALVEWIEYNRLLGVGEINIYDSRLDQPVKNIFNHYEMQGIVNVRKSAPPVNNWCTWCQKLAVIPALNDCMYRNMFRYKHMIVIDFDEFIVPKQTLNLASLILKLRNTWKEEPPAYMFQNAYFFKEFAANSSQLQSKYLLTTKYVTRIEPSAQGYAPKSIVNPRRCIIMQNHYCMIRTQDVPSQYSIKVNPDIALSHHYKSCHLSKVECEVHLKKPVDDKSILRFMKPLNRTVYEKLVQLKLIK